MTSRWSWQEQDRPFSWDPAGEGMRRVAGFCFADTIDTVGAPSFAFFAKGGYHERLRQRSYATRLRNEIFGPAFVHPHRPSFAQKIETITAPAPLLRRADQASLHRIAMHVPELLHAFLRRPYIEVVEASLPERSALRLDWKQMALARVARFALGSTKRGPCAASAPASRLRECQLRVLSQAGECVPASRHSRRPRNGSVGESAPESRGTGCGSPPN